MMTERWLNHLREKQPEDFERLQEMRQKDPEMFRREMHLRFRREIGARLERERPAIHDAIKNLPEADREWLFARMAGPDPLGPRAGEGPPFGASGAEPDGDFMPTLKAYRQAASDDERAQAKRRLRAEIQTSLERKNQRRRDELDQLEARLKEMRRSLEARESAAAEVIDAKLNELTTPPGGP